MQRSREKTVTASNYSTVNQPSRVDGPVIHVLSLHVTGRWTIIKWTTVWVKPHPFCGFLTFSTKRIGIFNRFFTNPLYVHFYTRLQIFIQLSPTLTNLCHTKCNHTTNFYISLEVWLLSLLTEQMTSLLKSCHIRHICWHYKRVYFMVTCHRQRSTKLSTT